MHTRFPKWKLTTFILLSICDFVITYLLLSHSQGEVYETNPVANQWLENNGWIGLAAFKAVIVAAVALIATYLHCRRPRIAHDLLAIGCGAVIVAVLSGTTIAMSQLEFAPPEDPSPAMDHTAHQPIDLDLRREEYLANLDEASSWLSSGEWTLAKGVARLEEAELAKDREWLASLRRAYPGLNDGALIAADLMQHTISLHIRMPKAVELAERLEKQFRELYGVLPKLPYRPLLLLAGSPAIKSKTKTPVFVR